MFKAVPPKTAAKSRSGEKMAVLGRRGVLGVNLRKAYWGFIKSEQRYWGDEAVKGGDDCTSALLFQKLAVIGPLLETMPSH